MAYKTCENCGCRIFEYGCVNCNERDYITMQDGYEPLSKKLHKPIVMRSVCCNSTLVNFNKEYNECFVCGKLHKKEQQTDA